jgi:hypothetical protein
MMRVQEAPVNKDRVSKMRHKKVKVRPIARRIEPNGKELPVRDDWWQIEEASKDNIKLGNPVTYHSFMLGTDHIYEYLTDYTGGSDGFLLLKSQIILKGTSVHVEPLQMHRDVGSSYVAS